MHARARALPANARGVVAVGNSKRHCHRSQIIHNFNFLLKNVKKSTLYNYIPSAASIESIGLLSDDVEGAIKEGTVITETDLCPAISDLLTSLGKRGDAKVIKYRVCRLLACLRACLRNVC